MWLPNQTSLVHVLLIGACSYFALLVILRISGARSLAKLNAFDFAVTVALGSIFASAVTSTDLSWGAAALAMALLLALQYAIAKLLCYFPRARRLLTADAIVVVRRGAMLTSAMKRARVSAADVYQAARTAGHGDLEAIGAMVVETDGSISVIKHESLGSQAALNDLASWRR